MSEYIGMQVLKNTRDKWRLIAALKGEGIAKTLDEVADELLIKLNAPPHSPTEETEFEGEGVA